LSDNFFPAYLSDLRKEDKSRAPKMLLESAGCQRDERLNRMISAFGKHRRWLTCDWLPTEWVPLRCKPVNAFGPEVSYSLEALQNAWAVLLPALILIYTLRQ